MISILVNIVNDITELITKYFTVDNINLIVEEIKEMVANIIG